VAANASSTSAKPLRFIGIFTPHGRAHELWQPRADFDIAYAQSSLQPFDDAATYGRSFKDRLLVIDGMNLSAGMAVGTTGHEGSRVILTGSGANGKNASLDQFLAVEQGLGESTPFSSLCFGIGADGSELGQNLSYAAGGTPIPKWIDPSYVFEELFAKPLDSAAARVRRAQGKSILDVVRSDLAELRARAPQSERLKFEQHQAALRDIEKRLTMTPPQCAAPTRPDSATFPHVRAYAGGERFFDVITDLQIDLLVRALACDLTRFSTLFLNDLSRTARIADFPNDVHSDVAHRYDARTKTHSGTPQTWQALAIQNRYTYAKVARLLQRLHEADLLDDTIVYVSSDMGDPARHSSRHVPTLIAGGCGGHFKMGRYIDLRAQGEGVPNNRVLVSICHAFGVEVPQFGHGSAGITTGRLETLHRV
jgi:hypothetical protein